MFFLKSRLSLLAEFNGKRTDRKEQAGIYRCCSRCGAFSGCGAIDEVLFLEIEYITATTVTVRLRDSTFAIVASTTWTAVADVGLIVGGVGAGIEDIGAGGDVKQFKLGEGHVHQKTAAGSGSTGRRAR